jgi:Toprim-like
MNSDIVLLHEYELARWAPKKSGGKLRTYCPVHGGDHQRSLEIRLEDDGSFKKGYGFCHNCKATVFVVEMDPQRAERIEQSQRGDGRVALRKIDLFKPRPRGASEPDQWQQQERSLLMNLYPRMRAALAQSERAQAYLRGRAIPLEVAQAAGVVYLPLVALKSPDMQAQRHLVEKWVDHLIFPLWTSDGRRGYAGRTLRLWQPGMDENEHKAVLEEYDERAGKDERKKIRRWRKTNPAGYFGVGATSLSPCIAVVEGAFDRLALLASGLEPPDVMALVGTALQAGTLPLQVQSVVLALDGDASGQKAAQKLQSELQTAGLAVTPCIVPQDGQGKDWSERWRTVADGSGAESVIEAWVNGLAYVEEEPDTPAKSEACS